MRKLFGIFFVFISMGSGMTQGKMPYAQCGPVAQSLYPQVLAIVGTNFGGDIIPALADLT